MREGIIRKRTFIKTVCVAVLLMVAMAMLAPAEVSAASKTPAQVKGIKVTEYTKNLKVTWSKITGVSGYQVYLGSSVASKYAKVATTTAAGYIQTGATPGKTYCYKVRAYKKSGSRTYYGKFSSVACGRVNTPEQVKNIKMSVGTNELKVSWDKVTGAKGYQVYRSETADGTYTTVNTTTSLSYTDKGLAGGKLYYYKTRAYGKSGSKVYYGRYSKRVLGKALGSIYPDPTPTDPSQPTAPDPYAAVDLEQINNDMEKARSSGEAINKQVMGTKDGKYSYYISALQGKYTRGGAFIGYIGKWTEDCTNVNGLEPGRWYGASYSLMIKSTECTAYYTTDGSIPSPDNGTKVTKETGRVKIKAEHTGNYGGGDDYINLKIHFYAKGELVALNYWEDTKDICIHQCQEGNGVTEKTIEALGYTLEGYINMQKKRYPDIWYEYLPENEKLLSLKKQYPASWWEHLPKDVFTLYNSK